MKRFCFAFAAISAFLCFASGAYSCDDCQPGFERFAHYFEKSVSQKKEPDKFASRFVASRFDALRFTRSDVYVLGLSSVDSSRPFYLTKLGRLETLSGVARKVSPSTRCEFGEWGDVVRCRYLDENGEQYTTLADF